MKKLNGWIQYNEKKKCEDDECAGDSMVGLPKSDRKKNPDYKGVDLKGNLKYEKKPKEELTKHDKMWNGVGENLKGIMTIIKDKDAEEIVSMLKNKIADGKLKFKDINAIKRTAKTLNELMK